ncbi:uncharacterized protein NPIL_99371 [Nephila pilipes]|uniref:Uncharacterized protein n=1 Tax=Nephila pilipes TaxID=299642 RepID=A0A8X6TK11_NEPPI|nr:uncharacterized protein NPIL_99371 [Nephila pilipes]
MITKLIERKYCVAAIKEELTPYLELSACLFLAHFIQKVYASLKLDIGEVVLHIDSTITLPWLSITLSKLKKFVGNRVSKIQSLNEHYKWKHISSNNKPAGIISRECYPLQLIPNDLWWFGS